MTTDEANRRNSATSPNVRHNPVPVHSAFRTIYSHGVEVAPNSRLLFVSGQIGVTGEGIVLDGFQPQFEQAIANLLAVLVSAGMRKPDLVKLGFFVTHAANLGPLGEIRRRLLAVNAAVTTVVVSALARPDLLVEVDAVAARP